MTISHLQRLREEELRSRKQRNTYLRMGWLLLALVSFCFVLSVAYGAALPGETPRTEETDGAGAGVADTADAEGPADEDSWELILVNGSNPLPEDFTVELADCENTSVDRRIAQPLQDMIEAARADGVSLRICSGFRSVPEQEALYRAKCRKYEAQGYSGGQSEELASQYLQKSGRSEHHTGLAVDFLTDGTTQLDERFAQTPAYAWLEKNAAAYGFTERYPQDKSQLTGISWEPWHYRYVGQRNAAAMKAEGVCLEEYLRELKQGQ